MPHVTFLLVCHLVHAQYTDMSEITPPPPRGGTLLVSRHRSHFRTTSQRWSTAVNDSQPPPDHQSTIAEAPVNGGQPPINGGGQPGQIRMGLGQIMGWVGSPRDTT
ncbi:hypothetical protein Tco_0088559 [Tanacetum coccineum]